jgi:hypothetical protein
MLTYVSGERGFTHLFDLRPPYHMDVMYNSTYLLIAAMVLVAGMARIGWFETAQNLAGTYAGVC